MKRMISLSLLVIMSFGVSLGFESVDMGKVTPATPGATYYDETTDTYTLVGTGRDLWGAADDGGRFMFKPMAGDCEVIASVERVTDAPLANWTRVGLMITSEVLNDRKNVAFQRIKKSAAGTTATGDENRLRFSSRDENDWGTYTRLEDIDKAEFAEPWLGMRLVRRGDDHIAYYTNSTTAAWTEFHSRNAKDLRLGDRLNAGVFVCRHHGTQLSSPYITNDFRGVIIRELVTSRPISRTEQEIFWVTDLPDMPAEAHTYRLESATSRAGTYTTVASDLTANIYTNSGLTAGSTRCYRVYAVPDNGDPDVLIGTGLAIRTFYTETNSFTPPAGAFKGLHAEYHSPYDSLDPVASVYQSNVSNSWESLSGIMSNSNMLIKASGTIIAPASDLYSFVVEKGYHARIRLNGTEILNATYEATDAGGILHQTVGGAASRPQWMEGGMAYHIEVQYEQREATDEGPKFILKWYRQNDPVLRVIPESAFSSVPYPWSNRSLGNEQINGGAAFEPASNKMTVAGGGGDIWGEYDNFRFISQPVTGDFDISARVLSQSGDNKWKKAGLMARKELNSGSVNFTVLQTPADESTTARWMTAQRRTVYADYSSSNYNRYSSDPDFPAVPDGSYMWLRITRRGDTLSAYARHDESAPWKLYESRTDVILDETAYVGIAVTSHDNNSLSISEFDNIALLTYPQGSIDASIAGSDVRLTLNVEGTTERQLRQAGLSPQLSSLWTNALGASGTYDVLRSFSRDSGYTSIGTVASAYPNVSFTDVGYTPPPNTVVYYRVGVAYDIGAVETPVDAHNAYYMSDDYAAVGADAELPLPEPAGTGLYIEYTSNSVSGSYADLPPRWSQVDGIARFMDNDDAGLRPAEAGLASEYYMVTMTGWFVPPVNASYQFLSRSDDGHDIWVDGQHVTAQIGYQSGILQPSEYISLQAGVAVPINIYVYQGIGGAYLDVKYRYRENEEWAYLPTARLFPLTSYSLAESEAALAEDQQAPWISQDIVNNSLGEGHVAVNADQTAFKLTGSGRLPTGAADAFHYCYKKTRYSFDFEVDVAALHVSGSYPKCGLMVRGSAETNAVYYASLRRPSSDVIMMKRDAVNSDAQITASMAVDPGATTLKLSYDRVSQTLAYYVDEELVETQDMSTWSNEFLVGMVVTSDSATKYADAYFNNVSLTINYPRGSLLLLK